MKLIVLVLLVTTSSMATVNAASRPQNCNKPWTVPKNFLEIERQLARCPVSMSVYAVVNRCPKHGKIPGTVNCDRQLNDHLNGGDNH